MLKNRNQSEKIGSDSMNLVCRVIFVFCVEILSLFLFRKKKQTAPTMLWSENPLSKCQHYCFSFILIFKYWQHCQITNSYELCSDYLSMIATFYSSINFETINTNHLNLSLYHIF